MFIRPNILEDINRDDLEESMSLPRALLLVLISPLLGIIMFPAIATQSPSSVEVVEFLEGTEHSSSSSSSVSPSVSTSDSHYTIKTLAYWNSSSSLKVSVSSELNVTNASADVVKEFLSDSPTQTADSHFSNWNGLLSSFPESNIPRLTLAQDKENANIHVILTNAAHPDGKLALTRLYTVKGTGEIISATVILYSVDTLREQSMLHSVLAHELGHALGLSHSTDPRSIMYSLLEMNEGSVTNQIGGCEADGISALYLESRIGTVVC